MKLILKYVILFSILALLIGCNQKIIKQENVKIEGVELFNAIDSNDIMRLESLLTRENVNSFDTTGRTLMSRAIRTKNIEYVKLLLKNGADPNLQRKGGYMNTPLMDCSNYNLVDIANLLIKNGANVDIQDKNGDPVIHWTAYYGEVEFTKLLLDNNANPKMRSIHSDKGAMQVALKEYRDSVVDLLLQYDVSLFEVDTKDIKIIEAVKNNDLEYIEQNITSTNINTRDQTASTLLIIAAQKGYFDIVQHLVTKGANLDLMNSVGQTALHLAVYFGHEKIAEFLVKSGADVNKTDDRFKLTPLSAASRKNRLKIGKFLLQNGADIESKDGINSFTPLFWAVSYENIDFVKLLLKYKPDISHICKYKVDVFEMTGNKKVIELLTNYKNNIIK